jgi:AraC family transcriptional regulator
VYKECLINDNDSDASITTLLLNAFEPVHEKNERTSKKWVAQIEEVLRDRWNENVSLTELSNDLNLHPVSISRGFPKHFQCTFGEYSRKIKIDKAVSLIKRSDKSLTEIALECGFFDQSHFIRTFKEVTGFTPKEYRRL